MFTDPPKLFLGTLSLQVHEAQKKLLLGLAECDEEQLKIAVIDAWSTYAFTKYVPYDQVLTYTPPPIERPSDVLPGGYTRAERHLLIGLGECLDKMMEISHDYICHLKVRQTHKHTHTHTMHIKIL